RMDLLTDEVQTGYFTDAEKDHFINMAQHAFMRRLFPLSMPAAKYSSPGSGGYVGSGKMVERYVEPLSQEVSGQIGTGSILLSDIESQLSGSGSIWTILSMSVSSDEDGTYYPSRWVSESEYRKRSAHKLLAGCVSDSMWYTIEGKVVVSHGSYYKANVLRVPVDVELGVTNCEYPEAAKDIILYLSLVQAGIATRDTEFLAQVEESFVKIGI
uniref:hypothetical protein n=1 Tax=uncultured Sphaerochaeta sp. TaxID=886478 RepID=UPI0026051B56